MTDPLEAIRQLYFRATAQTIEADFDQAIDLLKSLPSEAERERATVFMQGLAELRRQWDPGKNDERRKKAERKDE
jgi:hypothetical protein